MRRTRKDGREEVLSHGWRILLYVALVIVEWAILATILKNLSIMDHLPVEEVEVVMRDNILDDYQAIFIHVTHSSFKVPGVES